MWVCPQCHLVFRDQRVGICGIHGSRLVEQDFDPLVGRTVDRYQILERLGGGAMGSVYRAKHAVLDRVCAIKVLFGEYAHDENLRKRFEREAKAISRIRHPNVVAVSDFGTTSDAVTFLVMDYVDGLPLDRIIHDEAPMSPGLTARIARQIASGLHEAHAEGFVHRDMKPPNVMVSGSLGNEEVRILDFGLVSLLYRRLDTDRLTVEGQLVGTPMYMSPEQTLDASVGPPSDLYSLGVMMYEMLLGQPPFVHEGRVAMMFAHVHQPAPPLPDFEGLEEVVMKLLAKKPEDRYQSAKELIDGLDQLELMDETTSNRLLEFHDRTDLAESPGYHLDTDPSIPPVGSDEFIEVVTQVEEMSPAQLPRPTFAPLTRHTILMIEDSEGGLERRDLPRGRRLHGAPRDQHRGCAAYAPARVGRRDRGGPFAPRARRFGVLARAAGPRAADSGRRLVLTCGRGPRARRRPIRRRRVPGEGRDHPRLAGAGHPVRGGAISRAG